MKIKNHVKYEDEGTKNFVLNKHAEITFKSPNMLFDYFGVQGTLYKRIENMKIYHNNTGFSKKYFLITFAKE